MKSKCLVKKIMTKGGGVYDIEFKLWPAVILSKYISWFAWVTEK